MKEVFIMILVEIILFWLGLYFFSKYEEKLGMMINWKEYILIGIIFTAIEVLLFSLFGYGRDFICHSLGFFYLIIAAYIDYKTQAVYRIGSVLFIAGNMYLFVSQPMSMAARSEKLLSLIIFNLIIVVYGRLDFMGWGDVLTFTGVSFWLAALIDQVLALESCLYCLMLSSLIFIILNHRNIDWEKMKLRDCQAFLPSLAMGTLLTVVYLR